MAYRYGRVRNVKVKVEDINTAEYDYDELDHLVGATSRLYEQQSYAYDEIDSMTSQWERTYLYEN